MGREKSLDVQFEGVHAGVVDDDVDILIEPEHLYRPWESERVNKYQVETTRLLNRDELLQ
jgi:hypothetical protein